jgi:hypothetical protein
MVSTSNTDKPLVKNPRFEDRAADRSPDEQRNAEDQSLQAMHEALGRQADKIQAAETRAEDAGLVTRDELQALLLKHEAEMKSVMAVLELFRTNDPRRESPTTENVLEIERKVYEHTLEVLKTSPRVPVYIVPMQYEAEAIDQAGGKPLYRVICINGIQIPVAVGQVVQVPQPIAEIIANAKEGRHGAWRQQTPGLPTLRFDGEQAQDLETIPRPPRQPGADEWGRSGVVSTDIFRPFTSERVQSLDAR